MKPMCSVRTKKDLLATAGQSIATVRNKNGQGNVTYI